MQDKISITLGTKEPKTFDVGPLVFSQMRIVAPNLVKFHEVYKGRLDSTEAYDLAAEVIIVAVRKGAPDFAYTTIEELDCSVKQIIDAIDQLTEFSGIFRKKETPQPGE